MLPGPSSAEMTGVPAPVLPDTAGPDRAVPGALPGPFSLAIDAMGGDHAPAAIIDGLVIAAQRHPGLRLLLVGDEARLAPLLAAHARLRACCTVRHAPDVIPGDLKPTAALRLRGASMRVAIDAVAAGEALGVVSAGNTGALLALAKVVIKTLPGIDRPAMAAIGPSARGDVVHARPRRQRGLRRAQPGRVRADGRHVRPHRAGPDRARPSAC